MRASVYRVNTVVDLGICVDLGNHLQSVGRPVMLPRMTTVFVSIGRNVSTRPLTDSQWHEFQRAITDRLGWCDCTILGRYNGTGEWEGQTEDSAGWLFVFPYNERKLSNFRDILHDTGRRYDQESVGFIVHGPNPWANSYTGDDADNSTPTESFESFPDCDHWGNVGSSCQHCGRVIT